MPILEVHRASRSSWQVFRGRVGLWVCLGRVVLLFPGLRRRGGLGA